LAGCLLSQFGAKLFETKSVSGLQITIRYSASPHLSQLPPSRSAAYFAKKKGEKEKRKRLVVGHPSTQPAGFGSTPTKSSRHLLGHSKMQHAGRKEETKRKRRFNILLSKK